MTIEMQREKAIEAFLDEKALEKKAGSKVDKTNDEEGSGKGWRKNIGKDKGLQAKVVGAGIFNATHALDRPESEAESAVLRIDNDC